MFDLHIHPPMSQQLMRPHGSVTQAVKIDWLVVDRRFLAYGEAPTRGKGIVSKRASRGTDLIPRWKKQWPGRGCRRTVVGDGTGQQWWHGWRRWGWRLGGWEDLRGGGEADARLTTVWFVSFAGSEADQTWPVTEQRMCARDNPDSSDTGDGHVRHTGATRRSRWTCSPPWIAGLVSANGASTSDDIAWLEASLRAEEVLWRCFAGWRRWCGRPWIGQGDELPRWIGLEAISVEQQWRDTVGRNGARV